MRSDKFSFKHALKHIEIAYYQEPITALAMGL